MRPSSSITDRAKRYRANAETADWPQVCMFCGSTKDLQVDHLDGFEENGEPENLLLLCRSCNQLKSNVYLKHGMGRRTVQYNPGLFSRLFGPRETYRVHGAAHPEVRRTRLAEERERTARAKREAAEEKRAEIHEAREERARLPQSVGRYKGFTLYKRGKADDPSDTRRYYSSFDPDSWFETAAGAKKLVDAFKNPAASMRAWRDAVGVLRGERAGSPYSAARVIRSTPVARRYEYLDQAMRSNPEPPTYQQYAWAVSQHQKGAYLGRGKFAEGAHDEGGAIIHATPKKLRKEYASRLADMKSRRTRARRDEVPF